LCPISTTEFEKYLLDHKLVKKRFFTNSIVRLIKIFIKKENFFKIKIPNYLANNNYIIDLRANPKYEKIILFIEKNLNTYGLINISLIEKKYNLSINTIIKFLEYQNEFIILENKYIYENDKTRNRLYNSLQKIFNINATINKFHLEKALSRVTRLEQVPKFEILSKYCEKELDARVDNFKITLPKNRIDKFFYNSKKDIFSSTELAIISCFNKDKILAYSDLVNKLITKEVNVNTAGLFVSSNTPIIIKVAPSCYALVGTNFEANEIDNFFNLNKKKNKIKTNTEYDYNNDGTIWIGYEINKKNRPGKNFIVPTSLYDIIKGEYKVVNTDYNITVKNKLISRISNEKLKDKLLGEEIMFTFNKNKKIVEITSGKDLMKNKY